MWILAPTNSSGASKHSYLCLMLFHDRGNIGPYKPVARFFPFKNAIDIDSKIVKEFLVIKYVLIRISQKLYKA